MTSTVRRLPQRNGASRREQTRFAGRLLRLLRKERVRFFSSSSLLLSSLEFSDTQGL